MGGYCTSDVWNILGMQHSKELSAESGCSWRKLESEPRNGVGWLQITVKAHTAYKLFAYIFCWPNKSHGSYSKKQTQTNTKHVGLVSEVYECLYLKWEHNNKRHRISHSWPRLRARECLKKGAQLAAAQTLGSTNATVPWRDCSDGTAAGFWQGFSQQLY